MSDILPNGLADSRLFKLMYKFLYNIQIHSDIVTDNDKCCRRNMYLKLKSLFFFLKFIICPIFEENINNILIALEIFVFRSSFVPLKIMHYVVLSMFNLLLRKNLV